MSVSLFRFAHADTATFPALQRGSRCPTSKRARAHCAWPLVRLCVDWRDPMRGKKRVARLDWFGKECAQQSLVFSVTLTADLFFDLSIMCRFCRALMLGALLFRGDSAVGAFKKILFRR